MPLLSLHNICKNFAGLQALQDVSLSVEPGERLAIIGPNGAGKTTLFNVISGELLPSSGAVHLAERPVTGLTPERMFRLGLARTFQKNSLFLDLATQENVRLAVQAHRRQGHHWFRPWWAFADVTTRTQEVLERAGLWGRRLDLAKNLSYGEQRQLEMAIALAGEPKLLLLDEPTAGMSLAETTSSIETIRSLPRELALLIIEHDMDTVFALADRITVLDHGQVIANGPPDEVRRDPRSAPCTWAKAKPVLSVEGIHTYYGESHILQGVSLDVHAGELVALLGRNGAGKTTTISSIIGFNRPRAGKVVLNGRNVTGQPPYAIATAGVGLVPQGRRIFAPLTVKENLVFAETRKGRWTLARVYELFPRLEERQHNRGNSLSGGEQQMLAIGRALLMNPGLLLMDEPSEGLAPLVVREIGRIIGELKESGIAILLAEQNLAMALSVADRCYVLNKGQVVVEASAEALAADDQVKQRFLGL